MLPLTVNVVMVNVVMQHNCLLLKDSASLGCTFYSCQRQRLDVEKQRSATMLLLNGPSWHGALKEPRHRTLLDPGSKRSCLSSFKLSLNTVSISSPFTFVTALFLSYSYFSFLIWLLNLILIKFLVWFLIELFSLVVHFVHFVGI